MMTPHDKSRYLQCVQVTRSLGVKEPKEAAMRIMSRKEWREDINRLHALRILRSFAESGVKSGCRDAQRHLDEANEKIDEMLNR
jgi:hypothetical protein